MIDDRQPDADMTCDSNDEILFPICVRQSKNKRIIKMDDSIGAGNR